MWPTEVSVSRGCQHTILNRLAFGAVDGDHGEQEVSGFVLNIQVPLFNVEINIFTDIVLIVCCRCREMPQISVRGLFQAVRSQLHFSQLSAWWSCSKGSRPAHVNYRVTVPGEAFASQFQRQPVEHSFPVASISRGTAVKVFTKLGLI